MKGPRFRRSLVVIGDALLDRDVVGTVDRLSPDAPVPVLDQAAVLTRPGGAGLAALLAAGDGCDVTLVTALAGDTAGEELASALERAGVELIDLGLEGATPEKIRVTTGGRSLLRIDRGSGDSRVGEMPAGGRAAISWSTGVLVSDYGRGVAGQAGVRQALADLDERIPVVWDPHPEGPRPVPGAAIATPNVRELRRFMPEPPGEGLGALCERATLLAGLWQASHVCVTRGPLGALLVGGAEPLVVPARPADADPCGAGDRFAVTAARMLASGAGTAAAVAEAVDSASDFVAGGRSADTWMRSPSDASTGARPGKAAPIELRATLASVRAAGGVVVATGGCFDLLHAGHVRTLEAARELGDCLVVCLNSDDSVRRLKGPSRPLVTESDRAAVLCALGCVTAVAVFHEDTPEALLEEIRPDIWAKGGDYTAGELPERDVVERHGGRTVVLPYLDGHSTSRLIKEASLDAAG
jgi:D-beta-D-heptose 7-phosphate kinase / D-beta-D-heptose 1-phosphate adenosyltransferase